MKSFLYQVYIWFNDTIWLLVMAMVGFFSPTGKWVAFIGFLIVCDTITGVIAARKRKESVSSRKLARTIAKFISYGIALLISFYLQVLFFPEIPSLVAMTALIATIELKSIDENYKIIFGKSFFTHVINLLNKTKHKP